MKKSFEATGKTVEEALDSAIKLSGGSLDEAEVEILDPGNKGFLGIGGTRVSDAEKATLAEISGALRLAA